MADLEEVFKILKDDGTGAGEAPVSRVEGEAGAAKEGLIGFSFKDSSGNVVLPALTASGKIPVDSEAAAGTIIRDVSTASGTGGVATDVVTLTLTTSEEYNMADYMGASSRIAKWEIVLDDNGSESVLDTFITGPGQFTFSEEPKNLEFTAGATGTQQLILRGTALFATTDLHGRVSIIDKP
jgi:hypothetical protein